VVTMNKEQLYSIAWLKKHDLINQRALEEKCGLPQGSLYKAVKGVRNLPEHYVPLLFDKLKSYGYNPYK
jgi:hypothetical protein